MWCFINCNWFQCDDCFVLCADSPLLLACIWWCLWTLSFLRGRKVHPICDFLTIFQFGTNNLADVWGCERCLSFTLNVVIGYQCLSSHLWRLMFLVFAVTNADIACTYPSSPMYPFAFRTHTHSLGEILLYCIYLHQLSSYLVLVNCFTFYGASISWSCCCVLFFR